MLGNDLIDLQETKQSTNWQRPGFLDKVFSQTEQAEIHKSKNSFELVWRFWSMKESAYKVSIQYGYERSFKPSAILCTAITSTKGRATIGALTLETETKMNEHFILTVASQKNAPSIRSFTFELPKQDLKTQSKTIYTQILNQIAEETQWNIKDLSIGKTSENIPYISHKNKRIEKYLSISHHGKYGVFSILNS